VVEGFPFNKSMCCVANPYISTWKKRRRNRASHLGLFRGFSLLLPLIAVVLAAPMLRDVFLSFLDRPDRIGPGIAAFSLRLGWFCCAAMSLMTYSALVRGKERAVLDPHPGDPVLLLRYLIIRCGVEQFGLLICAIAMLWPVAWAGHFMAFTAGAVVVTVGWFMGLLVGFPVHLGAVWAAESKSLAGLMNALRGGNPRLQAALIYAPGFVLAMGGLGVWSASVWAELWLEPHGSAIWFWWIMPVSLAILSLGLTGPLARGFHYRTTALLSEIDSYYARLEDPEEAQAVYLQWAVRVFPASWKPYLVQDLRHGWRSLRSWITGAWGLGLLVAFSVPAVEEHAFVTSLALAGGAMLLAGGVGVRLAVTDPEWLDCTLPFKTALRLRARFVVVALWLQGLVLLPTLGLGLRHGLSSAVLLFALLEAFALTLAILATGAGQWRSAGWAAYIPTALVLWAVSLEVLT
jgi:hypothetical protein